MPAVSAAGIWKDHRLVRAGSDPLLIPCILLLLCTGCAAKRLDTCARPPPFYLRIEASDRVNPDRNGRSMPTVVQILQLKGSLRVEQTSFQKLWDKPKEHLAEELLQVLEFTIAPGQSVEHWIPRDPEASYVVAMGLFREPMGYSWRAVTKLPSVPESQCGAPPPGDRDPPKSMDEQLRFNLHDRQLELLRAPPPQADTSTVEQPHRSARPPNGRKT
jgi:type VI secretion system protein VasD